jgi:aspartyl-tRNA(Asn)/glutamyl-tRNA(Gln) amidotransferase subunit A
VRTASGSYAYAGFIPDEDDVVVERIKAVGAAVIGKTQVPEFSYSGTGQAPLAEPTRNPWPTGVIPKGAGPRQGLF